MIIYDEKNLIDISNVFYKTPVNSRYFVEITPVDGDIYKKIINICNIRDIKSDSAITVYVDDTNNRFDRPSIDVILSYMNDEGHPENNIIAVASVFDSGKYATAQRILSLIKGIS